MSGDPEIARCLFEPRSIALIGASSDEAKHTSLPQRYLRRHGYAGKLFPINMRRSEIFGERAYAAIGDVGDTIDHAFIMLPTDAVLDAVAACADVGVRSSATASLRPAQRGA